MAVGTIKGRLLIVDDEPAQMRALCETLAAEGYEAKGFISAKKALAVLDEERFDLLLTDLVMPYMDGIGLIEAAQQIDPDLVGVVMTGHGTIDSAVKAMQAGALDYVLKPFKLNVVLPVIERALAIRRLQRENRELARRVAEHTRALEIANRELEGFTYCLSHDLRDPLRAVDGCCRAFLENHGASEGRALLEKAVAATTRMEELVEDLLTVARVASARLNIQSVDVERLVREVMHDLQTPGEQERSSVVIGSLPACEGDRALLEQMFVTLLTGRAGVEIGSEDAQDDVEVTYFVRAHAARGNAEEASRVRAPGSGTSLSIVKRIAERLGGRAWTDVVAGQGAVVHVMLKKATSNAEKSYAAARPEWKDP